MPAPAVGRADDSRAALDQAAVVAVLLALLIAVEIAVVHHLHVCGVVKLDDDCLAWGNLDFGMQEVHGTTAPVRVVFRG